MLELIDSHAHLDFEAFRPELEDVVDRAREVGVGTIVTIGAGRGLESRFGATAVAERFDNVYATVGVHPHDASMVSDEILEEIETQAADDPNVVAVGETGLDYHYDRSPRDQQRDAFRHFIRMSRKLQLPVVVHSREAEADTIRILREEGVEEVGGILHCFASKSELAEVALELGMYVSFSGIATYSGADEVRAVARDLPIDRMLVETDAPYLTPAPVRGQRNEPAFVEHTLRRIAELRNTDAESLAAATSRNARRAYRLPGQHQ